MRNFRLLPSLPILLVLCLCAKAPAQTLVSIAVTPATPTISSGATQQFAATGTYSDGSTQVLTSSVTWSSSNTASVTIGSTGVATGLVPGASTIAATLGSVTGSVSATVTNTNLAGWWRFDDGAGASAVDSSGNSNTAALYNDVSWVTGQIGNAISTNGTNQYAEIPSVNLSSTAAITWTAWVNRTYGSGSTTLIENSSDFNSSETGFGLFPDDTADCGASAPMLTGVHGDVGYTLNCYAQPSSGVWHHLAAVYDKTKTGTNVISFYVDGVLQTPARQWFTVTNTNSFGTNPLYLCARGGTSQFATSEMDDLRIYTQALTAAQIQQIYQQGLGTLSAITVTPANTSLSVGSTGQYIATGTYSNGNTVNLTGSVAWSSSDTSVATISSSGLATGVAAGSTTIHAVSGTVSGSTGLTVTAAPTLVSITVTPVSFSLAAGATQQMTATGTYSDNSTENLTGSVTWSSNNAAAAAVSAGGLVTAAAAGSATIQATVNGISGSAQATVNSTSTSTNLAGWWEFDDGSGTTAADASGNGDTATLYNGVSWVTGQIGDAVSANGTNQYVQVPSVNLSSTAAITWTAWVNRTYGSSSSTLIENSSDFNSSTTGFGFFPDDAADCGASSPILTGVHGDVGYTLNCYAQPTSGVWHHLAAVYDKTKTGTSVISFYVDGVLQAPARQWFTTTNTNDFGANPLYLFSRGGASQFTTGEIDDLRIYTQALTAAQIQQIYQQGQGTLTAITVTPANATLGASNSLQYTATGTYSSGGTANLTNAVTWSSSNTGAATISSSGLATGVAAGSTTIQAVSGTVSGSTGLTVTAASAPPTLVSIAVTPASFSLAAGATQQLAATGTYSDGSTQTLTSSVTWSSSNTSATTVSTGGLVTAVAAGSATIQATVSGISGSAEATIVAAASSLAGWWEFDEGTGTTAADASGNGDTATLYNGVSWVTGQINDAISANGTNQYAQVPSVNLSSTAAITWTAWVNRTYGSGSRTLIESSSDFNGSTTGFGFFPDDVADCGSSAPMMTGVHGNEGYTLNCYAQPTSGVWHHLAAVYDKTKTGTSVISFYVDGVLQTPGRQWLTATNTNNFGANPLYLFSRSGTGEFTAGEMDDLRIYSQALTAAQIQQIYQQGSGTLSSITITPANASLNAGGTQQYTATGTYTSGGTANLTNAVTWSSSNTGAATISSNGLATGVAAGSATIQAVSGTISGSTGLTVTAASAPPTLVSIAVTPASFTLTTGATQQLVATGTYSDNSTQDLTSSATWSSSTPAAATVSTVGLVTAVAAGSATIQATVDGISGSAQATVNSGSTSNLAGWWEFSEGSGTTAADASGNGNTATLYNGVSWVTGQDGNAISTDGNSQYVGIPSIDLSSTATITWTAWINRTWGSGTDVLIENSSDMNSSATGFGFFPDDSADCGTASTMMTAVHGDVGYTMSCYTQPSSGVWHHLAVIYDKTQAGASVISLYVDGVLQTPVKRPYTATNTNNFGDNPTYLFARNGTGSYGTGQMYDLRLFTQALTAAQIQQIFQQGLGTPSTITVTPANVSIGANGTQQYTATGTWGNGAVVDVTSKVAWSSSNSSVATISGSGLATGVTPGGATIQATSGAASGSTGLTVTAGPTLVSIAVTPGNNSIVVGSVQQQTATGTYSDGSTQDVTSQVTWTSSNASVATISSSGLLTGVSEGVVNISAAYGTITGNTSMVIVPQTGKFAQWDSGDSGSTLKQTTYQGRNATTGNLVLVFSHWDNSAASATVQDQFGNTYMPIFSPAIVGDSVFQVWYAANITGGAPLAVTVNYSTQTHTISVVDVIEYSGLATTSPLDVYTSATGSGTAQNSGNMPATTSNDETIIGLFGYAGYDAPYVAGSGYNFRNYDASTMLEDKSVGTTGVYSATATSSNSANWAAFAIGFRNQLPMPPALILSPASVTAGNPSTGSIVLSSAAPAGGAVVSLVSSQPSVAIVPASITIAAGQTTGTFPITTNAVTFTTTATIFATYGNTQSATLTVVPTTMAQIASDNFNRADASTLGSDWTPLVGTDANVALQVVGSQIESTAASPFVGKEMYYGGVNWTPDQYSQVQIISGSGDGNEGPAVRMTSNDTHYACMVFNTGSGNANVQIVLDYQNAYATLASSTTATVNPGDYVRCTAQGTTLTMTDVTTATTLLTATDATIPSGYPGLVDDAGSTIGNYILANWSAGASAASLTNALLASDNFNRADALNLGSNWVIGYGHGPIQIVNDQIEPYPDGGTQPSKEHYIAYGPFPNDQWGQLQVVVQDTIGDMALELRASDVADNMYVCDVNVTGGPGAGESRIVKVVNGTIITLITDQEWTSVTPGDYIRGQVQGNLLSLIDVTSGTLLLSAFDSTFASGYPGISMQSVGGLPTDHIAANWSGGTFQ